VFGALLRMDAERLDFRWEPPASSRGSEAFQASRYCKLDSSAAFSRGILELAGTAKKKRRSCLAAVSQGQEVPSLKATKQQEPDAARLRKPRSPA
jgi:hypothetical protein